MTRKPGYLFWLPWDLHHPGGVNQVVRNLYSETAREERYAPVLLVASWQDKSAREQVSEGCRTVYLRLRSPWNAERPLWGILRFVAWLAPLLLVVSGLLRRHAVSVINIHYPNLDAFAFAILKWLRLYKGHLILSLHGTDLHYAQSTRALERRLFHGLYGMADAIVACSDALSDEARDFVPHLRHRVHSIHNGVDMQRWQAEQDQRFSLPPALRDGDFVLNVAKFEHKKGQDVLLNAFKKISNSYPGLKLVLIGAAGPAAGAIHELRKKLDLESSVLILENLPHQHISVFLRKAIVLALPSRWEGLPIVVLEAGATKVPVIATRVGGVPEIIVDGYSGLLVSAEDVDGLAAKIIEILECPERRNSLAAQLHRTVSESFTWRRAYEAYVRIVA